MSKKKELAKQVGFWATVALAPGGGLLLIYALVNNKKLQSKIKQNYNNLFKRKT